MTEFAKKLAELRKAAGETQEQLGEVLGVSGKTVSKWESDAAEPDLGMLLKIAEHYKTSTDVLLGKWQTGELNKILLDTLSYDGNAAGVFKSAFFLSAMETKLMMDALVKIPDERTQLNENAADALIEYHNADNRAERQIVHTNMGCRYAVWRDDLNLTVGLYRNKDDFKWLLDDADRLAELFSFFADADVLKVIYYLSRMDYPLEFTAEYTARTVGISTEKAEQILDRFEVITANDFCCIQKFEIELTEGVRNAYRFEGNGIILSLCAAAYNIMHGIHSNSGYNFGCKLIGTAEKKGE